jgi:hypothetical protein
VAGPRAALIEAVGDCERLVLLGDVLELRHGPARDALSAAAPALREVGAALPAGAEVVIVPGNHDHHLLTAWLGRRFQTASPPPLGLESAVSFAPGDPLATVAGWFGGAAVRAAYPGVWLRDDVYAIHGHYCDRHTTVPMFERIGAGVMARIVQEPPGGPAAPEHYEAILAPIYAWIAAIAERGGPDLGTSSHGASAQAWRALAGRRGERNMRRSAMAVAFPLVVAALNRARLGPLRADISGPELRRAALVAFGQVVERLRVPAVHVVFGHTHRAGPLAGDERSQWRAPAGAQLINTGSWVLEPSFLGPRPDESPYRPGFAVKLESDAPPELVNLLDGVRTPDPA